MENAGNSVANLTSESIQQTLPFFSLPAEIRNPIMQELLNYEVIAVQPRLAIQEKASIEGAGDRVKDRCLPSEQTAARSAKYPNGCSSFIATCRQAHKEGGPIFYSNNAFHVPPGPVEDMMSWMDDLRSVNLTFIPTIVLKLSLTDLPYERFVELLGTVERCNNSEDSHDFHYECKCKWICLLQSEMRKIWSDKLRLLMEWGQVVRTEGSDPDRLRCTFDDPKEPTDAEGVMLFDGNPDFCFANWAASIVRCGLHFATRNQSYESGVHSHDDIVKIQKNHETVFVAVRR